MKKVLTVFIIGILCISMFSILVPRAKADAGNETTLFTENFESYTVGAFPSAGGWELVWNGMGDQYQVITDAYCVSPTKSLQLWGDPNDWSAVVQKHFSSASQFIGYEVSMMVSAVGHGGPGRSDYVGFFCKEAYVWGKHYAAILFNHDTMNILTDDNNVVGTWTPGVWYNIKVLLDRNTNTYSVRIDGQLKGTNFHAANTDTNLIDAMQLQSDHPGVKDYFDDVRVFEASSATAGLIGYWKFDEGSGNIAHDSIDGNDGAINGATWTSGWKSSALHFNGIDNDVEIPYSASFDLTTAITIEAWAKVEATTGDYQIILAKWYPGANTAGSYVLEFQPDGITPWLVLRTSSNRFNTPSSVTVPFGSWVHIAGTYDGTVAKIYINGTLAGSQAVDGLITTGNQLIIGAHSPIAPYDRNWFKGTIDEVKIYNYARTAQEILDDYNSALGVSLPWRDDFSYNTKEEMKSAGWILDEEVRISVGGGLLTLDNDGAYGCGVKYMGHFLSGINDFQVEAKSKWIGRAYGSRVIYVWTQRHRYGWLADGYYPEYAFIRYSNGWSGSDDKVLRFEGFEPAINEWATMALEKRGNTFYMYQDGQLKNTYTEADSAPDELVGVSISGCWLSTVQYDYISVVTPTRAFDPYTDGFNFKNFGFFYTTKEEINAEISNNPELSQLSDREREMLTEIAFYFSNGVNWAFETAGIGGHCYGMSAAARYYFINPEEPEPSTVWEMSFEQAAPKIRELQLSSYVNPYVLGKTFQLYFNNPIAPQADNLVELSQIQDLIESDGVALVHLQNPIFETWEIWKCHSVLAYEVEETPTGWTVWVYDSNWPGIARSIDVDSSGAFEYSLSIDPTNPILAFHQFGAISSDATVFDYLLTFLRRIYAVTVHSPANVFITDPIGRSIGTDPETGMIVNDIPDALYSGPATEPQLVLIFDPIDGTYNIILIGTATGNYTLTIEHITADQAITQTFNGTISQQEIQYYSTIISETGEMQTVSWEHVFNDPKRGTMLKISTDDKYFQFIAPDKDFGVKHDPKMFVKHSIIIICYGDNGMRLTATAIDDDFDFCSAVAYDKQTRKTYLLVDKPNWRCKPN